MMQFIKTLASQRIILGTVVLLLPGLAGAQSSFLPQGSAYDHFLDRMQIIQQTNPTLNFSSDRPISRKTAVRMAEMADSLSRKYPYDEDYHLSPVDQATLHSLLLNNIEWTRVSKDSFTSKRPWFNTFYQEKANFYEVSDKEFFLAVDPVIEETQSVESGNKERVFLNAKGLTLRGVIGGKLGFSAFITDDQERGPAFFQQRAEQFRAVPGAGYYKHFKKDAYDYFDSRASIYFNALKYFDIQIGYDKNFIGDGYRSLLLSDYAAPYSFIKINTRVWKLNYQVMYMQLVDQHFAPDSDFLYPRKYGVIHHLSINAFPWATVGIFENVIFTRTNGYDWSYLNPVAFLVSAQQQNGSPDKTTAGVDLKLNIGHTVQLYGQLMIDEFILHQILHYSDGYWANKQGLQAGIKYINAFGVRNLDLQLETNIVRPYAYQHNDTVDNYSHYNQPLAHPLGANFAEMVGIIRYQPAYKWNLEGKLIYYKQGLDSAGINFGGNIFENYTTRPRDYGFQIGSGIPANVINVSGLVSYQWRENVFLELSAMYRRFSVSDPTDTYHSSSSTTLTAGVRINMFRRQYDY
ncbi:MAG TPA: hypothetical protein VFE32_09445 [Puia sp.]|jgi:hypothetical protein|nr:hypothetical protein [Puia sp.]